MITHTKNAFTYQDLTTMPTMLRDFYIRLVLADIEKKEESESIETIK